MSESETPGSMPHLLRQVRLPAWALPVGWPFERGKPMLADMRLAGGKLAWIRPGPQPGVGPEESWDVGGIPALPGLVDAHVHFSQAFTRTRLTDLHQGEGLQAGIDAMFKDRVTWTDADLRRRIARALQWSWEAGVVRVRSHVVWATSAVAPLAWAVEREMSEEWAGRIVYERVLLARLTACSDMAHAQALAQAIAVDRTHTRLGAFVHTSTFTTEALRNFFRAAQDHGVDVDLHIDEDLNPAAQGLVGVCKLLDELRFDGHVSCSHCCALSVQPERDALATLDAVARLPITLIACPMSNLLVGDATNPDRTPRLRGLTLVKEARARGIPVLFGSDCAQDPYMSMGACDPMETMFAAVLAGHLYAPFDAWTDSICAAEWLKGKSTTKPLEAGATADLVLFPLADAAGFPSRTQPRVVVRGGRVVSGSVPREWTTSAPVAMRTP